MFNELQNSSWKSWSEEHRFSNSTISSKQSIQFFPHAFIHPNQRRPAPFESFPGQLACGIDSHFRAHGDFRSGVVQHVRRSLGENAVPLGIGVRAKPEKNIA